MRLRQTHYKHPYLPVPHGTPTWCLGWNGWEWTGLPQAPSPDEVYDRVIRDVPDDNWKYHDCLHYKYRMSCEATNQLGFLTGGYVNVRFGNAAFGVADDVRVRDIIKSMPDYFYYISDQTDWLYNQFFALNELPTAVPITRDPFDSRFSIWMLLVDLLDIRKWGGQFAMLIINASTKGFRANRTVSYLANAGLFHQFGIKPTVKDVQDFGEVLSRLINMDQALAEICDKSERHRIPSTRKAKALLEDLYPEKTVNFVHYLPDGSAMPVKARITYPKREFHRTVRYGFSMPEVRGWTARFRQFAETLGVLDPSALWDRVPFSFIVDWFFNVSRWLHNNRPPLYRFDIRLDDYCESVTIDRRIDFTADWDEPKFGVSSDPTPQFFPRQDGFLGTVTVKQYVRRRFDPSKLCVIESSRPKDKKSPWTLRRFMIGSALVAQRVPRMRARR